MLRRDWFKYVGAAWGAGLALSGAAAPPAVETRGRRQYLDLSGPWRLRMDSANAGLGRRWFAKEPSDSEVKAIAVEVPSVWQQYLDIQGGIGWYFKDFDMPKEAVGKSVRLRFGAVDYSARVWYNGREVGRHEGAFTPFELDLTPPAKGDARIAVRVSDVGRSFRAPYAGLPGWEDSSMARVDGFYFNEIPAGFQDWREGFNHGGIWQPVELVTSDSVYVADVFAAPQPAANSVEVRLEVRNSGSSATDRRAVVSIKPWKGDGGAAGSGEQILRLEPGLNRVAIPVQLTAPHAWSPQDPFLYVAEVSLYQGSERRDDTTARFGFREFTIGADGFPSLNGKRITLKGAHYQSTEPLTLAFPSSRQMARLIVETAKDGGFNFMRYQGRPTAPSILDAADELGILVQSEPAMPRFQDNPRLEDLAVRETTELVRRDRNRPSIVIWNMINEQAAGIKVVRKMCQVARELDPTRLLTESAGGNSHYYPPRSSDGVSYLTEHYYLGAPLSEANLRYMRGRGISGQLYLVTEFGYGGLEDVGAVLEKYGARRVAHMEDYRGFLRQKKELDDFFENTPGVRETFENLATFREAAQKVQANAVRFTVESLRSNPLFGGFNIVQLFDSNANEVDGLVDFWRNKKKQSFYAIQEANRPLLLTVQCARFNPRTGDEVETTVTLVNEEQISGRKTLRVRAVGPSGKELFADETSVEASPWVTRLFQRRLPAGEEAGRVTVEAELRDGGSVLLKKSEYMTVFNRRDYRWPARGFAVFDPQGSWKRWRERSELPAREYDPQAERPELVLAPEFTALWAQPEQFRKFVRLVDQARRGSTILFLGVPRNGAPSDGHRGMGSHTSFSPLTVDSVLGFRIDVSEERGGWGKLVGPYGWAAGESAGCMVTRHTIYEGAPGPGLMDREYGNLLSNRMAAPMRLPVEHTGPAVQIIPFDSGKVVFCTLQLLENLEQDGLAEKLLSNLTGYLAAALPETLRPHTTEEQQFQRFQETQLRDCWEKFLGRT